MTPEHIYGLRWWLLAFFALILIFAIILIDLSNKESEESARIERSAQTTQQIKTALIHWCENNPTTEALIAVLIKRIQEEIKDSRGADPSLFPDIPPDQFRELVAKGIASDRGAIRRLENVDCQAPLK